MGMLYPLIRVLSPHLCFIPSSVFYPLIRVLSPHPCFIPSSVFYPLIRVLSPHPCFIPSSVFYPLIRILSLHPCFILSSVFYPLIRVLSPHPCFIPSSVSVSGHPYPCFILTRSIPNFVAKFGNSLRSSKLKFISEFTSRFVNKGCDWSLNSTKPIRCLVYKPACEF